MVSNHGLKGYTVHSMKNKTGCEVSQGHLTGTKGFMKQYPERKTLYKSARAALDCQSKKTKAETCEHS